MASSYGIGRFGHAVAMVRGRGLVVRRVAAALTLLVLSGCTHSLDVLNSCADTGGDFSCVTEERTASGYAPAADAGGMDAVGREYERQFIALLAHSRLNAMEQAVGIGIRGKTHNDVLNLGFQQDYRAVDALAGQLAKPLPALPASAGGRGDIRHFTRPWRTARHTLYLGKGSADPSPRTFYFSGLQALKVLIDLEAVEKMPATLAGTCNGTLRVSQPSSGDYAAGSTIAVAVGGSRGKVTIEPDVALTRCDFVYKTDAGSFSTRLTMLREETSDPALAEIDSRFEICGEPELSRATALERAFWRSRWLSQTCAMNVGSPVLLDDERAGFNAKVKALMGKELPRAAFDQANPEWPLDFSNAPKLSLIYVSYLDLKADFSGRVMERLLRWHAARGTKIRMVTTAILARPKDKALMEQLVADYPNISLQQFEWTPPAGARPEQRLYNLYRTHHVKMLGALSPTPGRSTAIIGGRNIHDGFLFDKPVDLTGYKGLYQYEPGKAGLSLHYYSSYNDFEMAFHDDRVVREMMAQLSTLWHRDTETSVSRPYTLTEKGYSGPLTGRMRHFISIPYSDGRALERQYVELLDAARTTIEFVNPYLNLTPDIAAALERAIDRGVKITIVGRIDLKGDLGGTFLTELNEQFVQKYADRIAVYEFKVPDLLLHAKLLLIDGEFVSVSSVNFNNRSFIHDSENGMIALDRGLYRKLKAVFESYRAQAVRLTSDVEIPWIYRTIFRSKLVREAL